MLLALNIALKLQDQNISNLGLNLVKEDSYGALFQHEKYMLRISIERHYPISIEVELLDADSNAFSIFWLMTLIDRNSVKEHTEKLKGIDNDFHLSEGANSTSKNFQYGLQLYYEQIFTFSFEFIDKYGLSVLRDEPGIKEAYNAKMVEDL